MKMADGARNKSVQYHRRLDRTPEKGFYRRPEEHKRLVVNLRLAIENARNKVVKMQTKLDEREQEIEDLKEVRQNLAIEKHSSYLVNMYNSDDVNDELKTRLSYPGDPFVGSVDCEDAILLPVDDLPSDEDDANQESDTETSHLYFSLVRVADPEAEVKDIRAVHEGAEIKTSRDDVDFNVKDRLEILKAGNTKSRFDEEDSAEIVTLPDNDKDSAGKVTLSDKGTTSELIEKSQEDLNVNGSEHMISSRSPINDSVIKHIRHLTTYHDPDEQYQGNLRTNVPSSRIVQHGLNPAEQSVRTNAPRINTASNAYSMHFSSSMKSLNELNARSLGELTRSGEGCQADTFQESRVKGHTHGPNVLNLHSDLSESGQYWNQNLTANVAKTTHQSEDVPKHNEYHCPRCSYQMSAAYQHTMHSDSLEYQGLNKDDSMAVQDIRVPSLWHKRGRHPVPQIDTARMTEIDNAWVSDATHVKRNIEPPSDNPYNVVPDKVEGKMKLNGSAILDMDKSSSNVALVKMLLADLSQSQHEVTRLTKELRTREATQQFNNAAETSVGQKEQEPSVPDFVAKIIDERNYSNNVRSAADEKHGYYLDSRDKDGNDIDSRIATMRIPNESTKQGQVMVSQTSQDHISNIENDITHDQQGVADLKNLLQEREIAAIEIDAVLKERDHLQIKYRKLKRKMIHLQFRDKDHLSTEQEIKVRMQAVTHERDYSITKIRELENEIELLKVVYNLHKSFSPNNDFEDELHVAVQNYHNYSRTKRMWLADTEPGSVPKHNSKANNDMYAKSEKEPLKKFENQRQENDEINKAEHTEKERLQRLVNVLRRKLLEHSLED